MRAVIKFLLLGVVTLVLAVAALLAGAVAYSEVNGRLVLNGEQDFSTALPVPPLLPHRLVDGEKVFDIQMQNGEVAFLDGTTVETLGYNGDYLGPTIRVSQNDDVRFNVKNQTAEDMTLHWHGMHLPPRMDGGPHQLIRPDETWQPHWSVTNEASTLWYHPHTMHRTGEQVYRGLAGMLIVDDANADALDLPKTYGLDDFPVIVQDRLFDASGQLVYTPHFRDFMGHPGMLGDTILVNGAIAPHLDVPNGQVRLRILNGSNARRYNFGFDDDRTFYQIATDGGLLREPVALTRVLLAPGERAEIVVDLSAQIEPLSLMSYAVYDHSLAFRAGKTLLGATRDEGQMFKILELRPDEEPRSAAPLPVAMNEISVPDEENAAQERRFSLSRDRINDQLMDMSRIDATVEAGTNEVWEVTSLDMAHPFHIHGVQFIVLSRDGAPPPANEAGWKDTVLVQQDEIVRLLVPMPQISDPDIPFMFHCHNLEHEDMGMMGQFLVVD